MLNKKLPSIGSAKVAILSTSITCIVISLIMSIPSPYNRYEVTDPDDGEAHEIILSPPNGFPWKYSSWEDLDLEGARTEEIQDIYDTLVVSSVKFLHGTPRDEILSYYEVLNRRATIFYVGIGLLLCACVIYLSSKKHQRRDGPLAEAVAGW